MAPGDAPQDGFAALTARLRPRVRARWKRALERQATDMTTATTTRSCLVVAPHPDDETLGCGATIARKVAAGTRVTVVVVADGRHSHSGSRRVTTQEMARIRAAEAEEACAILGLASTDLVQLGLEDTHVRPRVRELTGVLDGLLTEHDPEEVLVASRHDWHPDHQAVNAALRAAPALRGRLLLEYPIWYWNEGPWLPRPPRPVGVRLTDFVADPFRQRSGLRPHRVAAGGFLDDKRAALGAYRSQVTRYSGEPDWPVMDEAFLAQYLGPVELYFAG